MDRPSPAISFLAALPFTTSATGQDVPIESSEVDGKAKPIRCIPYVAILGCANVEVQVRADRD